MQRPCIDLTTVGTAYIGDSLHVTMHDLCSLHTAGLSAADDAGAPCVSQCSLSRGAAIMHTMLNQQRADQSPGDAFDGVGEVHIGEGRAPRTPLIVGSHQLALHVLREHECAVRHKRQVRRTTTRSPFGMVGPMSGARRLVHCARPCCRLQGTCRRRRWRTHPVLCVQLLLHSQHLRLPSLHARLLRRPGRLECHIHW